MCGRTSLAKLKEVIEARFDAQFEETSSSVQQTSLPQYNIAPSMKMPIITSEQPDTIQWIQWGFIPGWAKDIKTSPPQINARKESVLEKPYFKNAVQQKRCLVLMDGYFEWKVVGKQIRIPYYIQVKESPLFAVAGIWDTFRQGDTALTTFSVLTQQTNSALESIHERMPAILQQDQERKWIDKHQKAEELISMIQPYASDKMEFYTVSNRINKSFENDASLIIPSRHDNVQEQGSLF